MASNLKSLFGGGGGTSAAEASGMAIIVGTSSVGGSSAGSGQLQQDKPPPALQRETADRSSPVEYSSFASIPKTTASPLGGSNSSSISSSSSSSSSGSGSKTPNTLIPDPHQRLHNRDVVITSLVAGAIAGALAKTTIAPLDRTKINFQINKDIPYSWRAAFAFIRDTYTKEGFMALWRGNSATMARIIPYSAIQFTAHEQWKKLLHVDRHEDTKVRRFIAGSLAGITSQSLTYPLDLARARMAVTDKYSGYRTLREVFVKIWQCEGPRTFYRGYWATILGVIPYAGMSFFTYDTLKKEYFILTGDTTPNTVISLMFGATAGVIGQSSSYPLDIVRRRMQTTGVTAHCADRYLTIGTTLVKIYREEGIIKGFYKGLSMNWIKGPIAVGISFATYDHIKYFLRELIHLRDPVR